MSNETIAAIATPLGRGGIGIVRISGSQTKQIAQALLKTIPKPRTAEYLSFYDAEGNPIDKGIALFFPSPHSFTGEDVLEIQGHGGPVILDLLLQRIIQLGGRLARPGEFSERAFLNDKIDLIQAEAIADLIDAASTQAARAALSSLQGEFSRLINQLIESLIALRLYIEAAIDFPEEEIDFLSDRKIETALLAILDQIQAVLKEAKQGAILREGIRLVIMGKPNVGKSSLLNRLCGRDSAIVTDIPGTTRDILREYVQIDGIPLHIIDTAGLRESEDIIEQEGIRRAKAEISTADQVLLMIESSNELAEHSEWLKSLPEKLGVILVYNKIDLSGEKPGSYQHNHYRAFNISAKTGGGLDVLKAYIKATAGFKASGEGGFIARRRHIDALERAAKALHEGRDVLLKQKAGELLAQDLLTAQQALSEITGKFTSDELLGKIFSSFCIGK